jgi:hypothetical protein
VSVNWPKLLSRHGVAYVERGPSTSRGNIYVRCPWCAEADRGHHMGVSTEGHGWGCWRNVRHRGRDPARLLAALLSIPEVKARALIGNTATVLDDGDLASTVHRLLDDPAPAPEGVLTVPDSFRRLSDRGRGSDLFFEYIQRRGYTRVQAAEVSDMYNLMYAMGGPFAYRLIFPVRDLHGGLVTFTGRTVAQDEELRYLTLSPDPDSALIRRGMPRALGPITDCIFNEHELFAEPPEVLIVCEGPLDCVRVDYAHAGTRTRATGLFGKNISPVQMDKIGRLAASAAKKYLLLDPDARYQIFDLLVRLEMFGFAAIHLDECWEDPGDKNLPLSEIRRIVALGG